LDKLEHTFSMNYQALVLQAMTSAAGFSSTLALVL